MPLSVVTPPTSFPVSLAEAKAQCRIESADEDLLVTGLIEAATRHIENYTGRALAAQTLRQTFDTFSSELPLPRGPVQSVTSVTYVDEAGMVQTASASLYSVSGSSVFLKDGATWPSVQTVKDAVKVTYVTGEALVSPAIKHAALLLIGQWYGNREAVITGTTVSDMPNALEALLANERFYGF